MPIAGRKRPEGIRRLSVAVGLVSGLGWIVWTIIEADPRYATTEYIMVVGLISSHFLPAGVGPHPLGGVGDCRVSPRP